MAIFTRSLSRRRRYLLMPRPGEAFPIVDDDGTPFVDGPACELDDGGPEPPPLADKEHPARLTVSASATTPFSTDVAAEPLELLLTSPDGNGTERIRIDESTALVGRGRQADLRLPHPDVSRCHVLLHRVADRVLFADLCSRTGVRLNGDARASGWLTPGDVLQLGPFSIRWPGQTIAAAAESGGDSPDADSDVDLLAKQTGSGVDVNDGDHLRVDSPLPWLSVTGGRDVKADAIQLRRPVTLVGRSPSCDLTLGEATLARVQVVFLAISRGIVAVDLERRGRFVVNGIRCDAAGVAPGDELCIGSCRLTLSPTAEPPTNTSVETQRHPASYAVRPEPGRYDDRSGPAGTSDDAVRALVAALADLQRRFQERSRRQLELLPQLRETAPSGLQSDVDAEIERLRQIVGEDLYETFRTQFQSVAVPVETTPRRRREETLRRAFGPRPEPHTAIRPPAGTRPEVETSQPDMTAASTAHGPTTTDAQETEPPPAAADYARIAQRVASRRQGRSSRSSGWGRLFRSVFLMG